MSEIPKMCRFCLQEEVKGDGDSSLYDMFKCEPDNLCEIIANCTGICILREDLIPPLICKMCKNTIENFSNFFDKARSSELFLNSVYYRSESEEKDANNDNFKDTKNIKTNITAINADEVYESCSSSIESLQLRKIPSPTKSESALYFPNRTILKLPRANSIEIFSKAENADKTSEKYACGLCPEEFNRMFEYQHHQLEHNGHLVFGCSKCKEVFNTREELIEHDKKHKITCHICNMRMMPKSLAGHMIKHTDKFKCSKCKTRFSSKVGLDKHVAMCKLAVKGTKSGTMLRRRRQQKPIGEQIICEICNKSFKTQTSLMLHKKRVHGQKKYTCTICGKHFSDKFDLLRHGRKNHMRPRSYACPTCQMEFMTTRERKKHMLCHKHASFKCMQCSKKFDNKKLFEKHLSKCMAAQYGGYFDVKNSMSMPDTSTGLSE